MDKNNFSPEQLKEYTLLITACDKMRRNFHQVFPTQVAVIDNPFVVVYNSAPGDALAKGTYFKVVV